MKKLFLISIALVMVLGVVGNALADAQYTRDPGYTVSTLVVTGETDGTVTQSTISSGNKILGFTYTDSAAGSCGLYDHASSIATSTNLFGEAYCAAGAATTIIFPFPKKLNNGLTIAAGATTGKVIIYYE